MNKKCINCGNDLQILKWVKPGNNNKRPYKEICRVIYCDECDWESKPFKIRK